MGEFRQLGKLINWPDREAFLESLVDWSCPTCGAEVSAPEGHRVADRRCWDCIRDPQRRLSRAQRLAAVGTPARYRQDFVERAWPTGAEQWTGSPWAVGFVGLSDAGKTMLATELFWRLLDRSSKEGRPWPARWTSAAELADSGFANGSDRELYDECTSIKLLLIDDLGWGGGIEKLFELISARHRNIRPTIWTANTRLEDLSRSAVGQPLVRRLQDDGLVCGVTGRWNG